MALIQFGSLVTGIRGKVGGSLFSTNNGTAFVSNQSRKTKSLASRNQLQKQRYNQVQNLWKSLSADERATWIEGAKSEVRINKINSVARYTPRSLFFERNLNLLSIAQSMINNYTVDNNPLYRVVSINDFVLNTSIPQMSGAYVLDRPQSQLDYVFTQVWFEHLIRYSVRPAGPIVEGLDYNIQSPATYDLASTFVNIYPGLSTNMIIYQISVTSGKRYLVSANPITAI